MKLKKGDKIKVMVGKDKGREGTVDRVYIKQNKVLVPGVNIYKRHVKKTENNKEGGIIDIPRPLAVSKVMLICPKCKKLARVGYSIEKGRRYRICKRCKSKI